MNAVSSMKSGMIGFALAVIAILIASPQSRAQDVQPKRQALPPVSHAKYLELQKTPGAWEKFLARFPQLGAARATQNRVQVPTGGTWTNVPNNSALNPETQGLTAQMLLTDGTVLAHDADLADWWKLTPDINGNYANGTWSQVASMPMIDGSQYAPLYTASAVLPDGRLIVEGGEYNDSDNPTWVSWGAIYDPLANTWTAVTEPTGWPAGNNANAPGIGDAESVVLANG